MFPVKEIMSRNVIVVKPETSILNAVQLLVDNKITGVPVVDNENNLVGILSEFDALRLLYDTNLNGQEPVEQFMSKNVIAFPDTASAVEICEFFLKDSRKRRVPITNHGKLVGLVSRHDIIKLIVKLRKHSK
jgi:CBS domain-containing protein